MANKVSVEDLRAMFSDTLVMYRNKPYYIESISERYYADCRNLVTQRNEQILMDEDTFTAPLRRIGMVNCKQSVVYLSRRPVRRYKAGLCRNNTNFSLCDGAEYPRGTGETVRHLYNLNNVEIADAMFGKYPTIEQCIEAFEDDRAAAMAFDHQFALTRRGCVLYKTQNVGSWKKGAKTPYDLVFNDEWAYLIHLLDNNHEKSLSAS